MRNLDGALAPVLEHLVKKGASIVWAEGRLSRVYEAARFAAQLDGRAVAVYNIKELPYVFASNIVYSRKILYMLLEADSDMSAYEKILSLKPESLARGEFSDYFEEAGSGLDLLPALRFYEGDGGLYVTSSIFIACNGKACNASIHRIMVSDDYSYAAVRVVPRHLYRILMERGGSTPVAVVVGVDPRIMLAAALSPPFGVFELELAAALTGGLRVCETPRYRLPVPCGASMVIEAVLGPERRSEGPFVDLLGLYDNVRSEPELKVESIYVNKVYEPVLHAILPGGTEHKLFMGFPREASIYDAVRRVVPRVVKVRLTPGSGMWLHAVISIEKQHDGDGKNAGLAALAGHPSLKHVVVVDADIDPDDPQQVEWAIATRLQADRGIVIVSHARGSTLDPSAVDGLTAKLIVDATVPIGERSRYTRPIIPGS
ncbi:UbiD family decarboxylase [Hyperthermus butylicus]|uniref:Anhydromevalonate phosphate decarboxylase n=1 Tax=Hyperthermus butylicus (strain DSM 5456 / JCM 9403 / PLM1-5) TaxID=415426 RepID=A2BN88_HYPBU|nr:UbiD family decarboxylase [Hyperthermus butylicus]ABM81449.1 putative 3-octaprenyl-4-hydroxybenzoate carboxylase [Hyperthermus butylicus DSM 5456]